MRSPHTATAAPVIGPLVEPGPELPPERLARYGRQLAMPGFDTVAQRRLANARVLVVGAGGLGSASIPYLAAAGVGTIGVVDDDTVELSNLHRQVSHGVADLGRSKLDSIADTVARINAEIAFVPHHLRLDAGTALEVFAHYDVVLDGSDNFATRYLCNDAAELTGIPVVWGALLRYGGQAGVSFGRAAPTYRDLFPTPPPPDAVLSCAVGGAFGSVCAVIGGIMSAEAIKLLTGIGEPLLGRVTTYDAATGRFREISYGRSPDAAPVTELIDYELFCRGGQERTADVAASVTPRQLAARLDAAEPLQLVDVREPFEHEIARVDGAVLIPLGELEEHLDRLQGDIPLVVFCHHDTRSRRAAEILARHGLRSEWLEGGIDAYAREVDGTVARY